MRMRSWRVVASWLWFDRQLHITCAQSVIHVYVGNATGASATGIESTRVYACETARADLSDETSSKQRGWVRKINYQYQGFREYIKLTKHGIWDAMYRMVSSVGKRPYRYRPWVLCGEIVLTKSTRPHNHERSTTPPNNLYGETRGRVGTRMNKRVQKANKSRTASNENPKKCPRNAKRPYSSTTEQTTHARGQVRGGSPPYRLPTQNAAQSDTHA